MPILPAAIFGIGVNEFMLLVLLALVIIGPKRMPEVLRGIGKLMAQFKRATNDLRDAVGSEFDGQPGLKELKDIRREIGGDMRNLSERAKSFMTREFEQEQEALGTVERDMHGVANDIGGSIRAAEEDAAAELQAERGGPAGDEGEADSPPTAAADPSAPQTDADQVEIPADREPWNVQMNKLFFRDKIERGEMDPEEGPKPVDSPEDAYVAEREEAAPTEPAAEGETQDSPRDDSPRQDSA